MALKSMPNYKTPGPDHITTKRIKNRGTTVPKIIQRFFNRCLKEKKVPQDWNNTNTILIHKKGDRTDLKNYRPISLLSHLYKLFTKILTNRLKNKLEKTEGREQASFEKGYSTIDHIHTLNQILEKTKESNLLLCMAFIDDERAFDTLEKPAIIEALENQHIEKQYIDLVKHIYDNDRTSINFYSIETNIKINGGIREGDTMSSILFNSCLEDIFIR